MRSPEIGVSALLMVHVVYLGGATNGGKLAERMWAELGDDRPVRHGFSLFVVDLR